MLKDLAVRKLKEFDLWRSMAGFYPYYFVDCMEGHYLPLFELPKYQGEHLNKWQRLAPFETNEIIKAVNSLRDERYRVILLMGYLTPIEHREDFSGCYMNKDIMERLGLKSSQFYKLKHQALLEFARAYRQGALLDYMED